MNELTDAGQLWEKALQVIQRVEANSLHRLAIKPLVQNQWFRFCNTAHCHCQIIQRLLTDGLVRYLKTRFKRVRFPVAATALNLFHLVEIQLTRLVDSRLFKVIFQSSVLNRTGTILMRMNHGSLAAANRGVAEYELSE
ncbi:hypothetical protein [Escherichia coli]|uniref:hypothetical protein n=1 Tax=Escherichia coli TaxID=562 RepID=UPI000DD3AEDD|nr:hypothetical protein [Escherichia coli]